MANGARRERCRSRSRPSAPGHDHEHGRGLGAPTDPVARTTGQRGHDGRPRRPTWRDEDRLARSCARRRDLTYSLLTGQQWALPDATGVTVTDTLPAVTFDSATPSQGTCSQASGTVTCTLGGHRERRRPGSRSRSARQSAGSIRTRRRPATTSDPSAPTTARARTTTVDPDRRPLADEDRLARPGARRAGADVHADASQRGPSSATGVTVTDSLPRGVTYQSATPSQGSCSQPPGPSPARSGADERRQRDRLDRRDACRPGTITNTATVTATADRSPPTTPRAPDDGRPVADLSLTKTDSPDPVWLGQHSPTPDGPQQRSLRARTA